MTETLDYAHPPTHRRSKLLQRFAFACLFYPLFVVVALYGEWLLASWSLGHAPRPSLDDPMQIGGPNLVHGITALAILGAIPAALAGLALNIIEVAFNRPSIRRTTVRMTIFVIAWLALYALLRWDPGAVVDWWFD